MIPTRPDAVPNRPVRVDKTGLDNGLDLVLASGSPRRRQLIDAFGVDFACHVPGSDESALAAWCDDPETLVRSLAFAKLVDTLSWLANPVDHDALDRHHRATDDAISPQAVVLAADTIVIHGDEVLGKPTGPDDLRAVMRSYSGQSITVMTALALCRRSHDRPTIETVETGVTFRPITEGEVDAYVASGEGDDKAGGLALQGGAGQFIEAIDGCWSNVIGLPLCASGRLLRSRGMAVEAGCLDRDGAPCPAAT